jgi:Family of unknown function (DUF5361)
VLLAYLPPESATYLAVDPKAAEVASWSRTDHLLASVFDSLQVLIWQNANEGRKSPTPKPRPLPRPGMEGKTRRVKGTPMPLDELRKRLPGIEGAPSHAG